MLLFIGLSLTVFGLVGFQNVQLAVHAVITSVEPFTQVVVPADQYGRALSHPAEVSGRFEPPHHRVRAV